MADSNLREAYFRAVGFEPTDTGKVEAALSRAREYRTLEIDLYWKRATYYWAFQAAVFAAFGLVLSEHKWDQWLVLLVLCGAGVLTAYAGVLGAKGSKFWQENWEKQVDMLEATIEGDLHKTVWMEGKKRPHSVTKINEQLSWGLFATWLILLGATVYYSSGIESTLQCYLGTDLRWLTYWVIVFGVVAGSVFACARLYLAKSDLSGEIFQQPNSPWSEFPPKNAPKQWSVLRRKFPGEVWSPDGQGP